MTKATMTTETNVTQYEVIIKRTTTRLVVKRLHTTVEERPYTDEEVESANSFWRNKQARGELSTKDIKGWSAPVEDEETETEEVYRQKVNDLDMVAVINAINGVGVSG